MLIFDRARYRRARHGTARQDRACWTCSVCAAGRDRFAVDVSERSWNCDCGEGGSDAISLCNASMFETARRPLRSRRNARLGRLPRLRRRRRSLPRDIGAQVISSGTRPGRKWICTRNASLSSLGALVTDPDPELRRLPSLHPAVFREERRRNPYAPCQVTLVRDVITDQPQAIHRTARPGGPQGGYRWSRPHGTGPNCQRCLKLTTTST